MNKLIENLCLFALLMTYDRNNVICVKLEAIH